MAFLLWIAILQTPANADDFIAMVKSQYLDINQRETVGQAFGEYPWFERTRWSEKSDNLGPIVVFEGVVPDKEAVRVFEERHKYKFKSNFKAVQLKSIYGLEEGRDKLSFVIHFRINPDRSFQVESGSLGVRDGADASWRYLALTDKALLFVIKGFYVDRDPYMSLVRGLPFK